MKERSLSDPNAYPVVLRVGVIYKAMMDQGIVIPVVNEGGVVRV